MIKASKDQDVVGMGILGTGPNAVSQKKKKGNPRKHVHRHVCNRSVYTGLTRRVPYNITSVLGAKMSILVITITSPDDNLTMATHGSSQVLHNT